MRVDGAIVATEITIVEIEIMSGVSISTKNESRGCQSSWTSTSSAGESRRRQLLGRISMLVEVGELD